MQEEKALVWQEPAAVPSSRRTGLQSPAPSPPAVPGPREGVYLSEPGGGARVLPAAPRRFRRHQWQLGSPSAKVPSHAG